MTALVATHALTASLALLLGGVTLARRPKGDRPHRMIGRVWVLSMYWTVASSFFVRELDPGGFSWIHGLSAFTFLTLTIGLWAAVTGRRGTHRGFMVGSYLGTVGAFAGAVVVPQRAVPQLAVQQPWLLSAAALGVGALAWGVATLSRRGYPTTRDDRRAGPRPPAPMSGPGCPPVVGDGSAPVPSGGRPRTPGART